MYFPPPVSIGGVLAAVLATSYVDPSLPLPPTTTGSIPVLEAVKVYGKIAGSHCYGKTAPIGSSCQITVEDLERTFQQDHDDKKTSSLSTATLTLEEFQNDLNQAEFQWPLKPYGLEQSLTKTATMNKGAETMLFMEELGKRGLYDKRNPVGPLPTSLRPQLNKLLQREGVDPNTSKRIFEALGGVNGLLEIDMLRDRLSSKPMNYYDFIELVGKDVKILWPSY